MKLKPLDNRVVVEPVEADKVTPGGIVLPDAAQEKSLKGRVVAVGPGWRSPNDGSLIKVFVEVGDTVLFGAYTGTDIEVDGKSVKILRESDILAVVEE